MAFPGVSCARPALIVGIMVATVAAAGCRETGDIEVTGLELRGVDAIDDGRLRAVLATQPSARLPWGTKRYLDRPQFEADLKRIEAFLADRGYPDARIVSFDLRFNDARDHVDIEIVVSQGEPVVVDEVRLDGFDVVPEDHLEGLRAGIPVRPGEARERQQIQVARDLAVTELRDHGYPYAKVEATEMQVGARRVVVALVASPGQIARFGAVDIAGNASVDADVIRRQLTFRPGELFRVSRLQESQRKLYGLELFQFANVEPRLEGEQPAEVPIRVTVAEGKHRRFTFGVGYGTEEKARGEAEWRHVNFFGGARTAGLHGRWSSLSRGVRADFGEPYFFHPSVALGLGAERWFADEPAYQLDTIGGRVTIARRTIRRDPVTRLETIQSQTVSFRYEDQAFAISNAALLDLSFRDELIALGLDPRTGTGTGTLAALGFDVQRNTTGSLLNASRGYVLSGHVEQAGRWLPGTFEYYELSGEVRNYWTIARRAVIANRLRVASIDGRGAEVTSVPFFKRYFLGGSTSLRGWGRFQVGPTSGSGLPIGGHSLFEATTELRLPLAGKLGGVAFLDAGNVWSRPWDLNLGDLRYAVGPGFRYVTPIGPIRFDLGYQLTPIPNLLVNGQPERRRWRMHFSIGHAF